MEAALWALDCIDTCGDPSGVQVSGVHHIAIKTHDLEGLTAFYVRTLGLREAKRHEDEGGLRSIWLECASAIVMIERSEMDGGDRRGEDFRRDAPGFHLLAFHIDGAQREAWREHLRGLGHRIQDETAFTLYVQDPDGNRVGLSSWPDTPVSKRD